MPVSRKRKKKSGKSGGSSRSGRVPQARVGAALGERDRRELADAWSTMVAHRAELDARRMSLATAAARELVTDLLPVAAERERPDSDLADELCTRIGTLLHVRRQEPLDDRMGPGPLAEALIVEAAAAVRTAVADAADLASQPDTWRAPWRVLTVLDGILSDPYVEIAAETIGELRSEPGGQLLPATPPGLAVTGPVLWTRDVYGSRFGVVAEITSGDEPPRWYLWDIDACGHQAFTVYSGFFPTPDQALAAWQAGVGQVAAAGTTFAPVDDERLLTDLLPAEEGILRVGEENADQFAEYYRSKRLGQIVIQTLAGQATSPGAGLGADTAATEFAAWLRSHRADQDQPEDLDELVGELADSWCINHIDAVYASCSPHRVALCVLHMRNYYLDDFANQLIALLPDWTRWLAERNATPAHLADRCLPYAQGQPHAEVGDDDSRPCYLARVAE